MKYDIVIVPTYDQSNFNGSKINVHISYYNYKLQPMLLTDKFGDIRELEFIVGRGNNLKNKSYDFNFREAHMPIFPWIVGVPNMVPLIIHDLIHYSPSKIKVFGVDFFAGKSAYFDDYHYKITEKNRTGFAIHNLVANWRYVRHLVHLNYLEMDSMGQEVLDLTESKYIKAIKENYYDETH